MALTKRTYTANETVITAENLNAIQDEIIAYCVEVDQVKSFNATQQANARSQIGASGYYSKESYGVCDTAAATAAKTVTLSPSMTSTDLVAGAKITIKFANSNTASNATLNVNGTGAKPIMRIGSTNRVGTTEGTSWSAGAIITFVYDGTNWVMEGHLDLTYTVVSTF